MCSDSALPPSLQDSSQADEERLILESNPLEWSVTDVVRFIKLTDCAPLARIFQEQVLQVLSLCVCMSVGKCRYLGLCVQLCVFMCAVTCTPVCT